ncbi:MAG: hypothetical protein V8S22_08375 [Lachnospiraceae bacterium]
MTYPVENEAREKLGEAYRGLSTDWDAIPDIIFGNKVMQLLSGNISAEMKAAFISGESLYSDAQVAELRSYLRIATEIEAAFPTLGAEKNLNAKLEVFADLCAALRSAIRTKIHAPAYAECSYSAIIADLEKLARVQENQVAFDSDFTKVKKILTKFTFDSNTDWDYMVEIFNHLRQVKRAISTGSVDAKDVSSLQQTAFLGITAITYKEQIVKLVRNKQLITTLTDLFANKAALESCNFAKLARRLRNCNEQFSTMDAWIDLRDCKKACVDNGLEDFILAAEDSYYPPGRLNDVFMKSFYYEWFEKVCTRD